VYAESRQGQYAIEVDALFQITNAQAQTWQGEVRSLGCSSDGKQKEVSVTFPKIDELFG